MERSYAERYRNIYDNHWWWRAREAFLLDQLRRLKPNSGFGAILDVGCGDGLFTEKLREFGDPEGLESDASLVSDAARARNRIHVQPFDEDFHPGRQFGLILMLDVIEHVQNDRPFLARALDLLAPGGIVLITVPAFPSLWTRHDDLNQHFRRYTKRSFNELAREVGFAPTEEQYIFNWLALPKLATRFRERISKGGSRSDTIPPGPINRAVYLYSRLEQKTYGRLPLPLGTSLMVIGSRKAPR